MFCDPWWFMCALHSWWHDLTNMSWCNLQAGFLTKLYWYLKSFCASNTTRNKTTESMQRFVPWYKQRFMAFGASCSPEGVLGCTPISQSWEEIHMFGVFILYCLFFIVFTDGQGLSLWRLRCAKIVTMWKRRKMPGLEFDVVSIIN